MSRRYLFHALVFVSLSLLALGVTNYASGGPSNCNIVVKVVPGTNNQVPGPNPTCQGDCPVPPGPPCTYETRDYGDYSRAMCYCAGQFPTFCKGNYKEHLDFSWTLNCFGNCPPGTICQLERSEPYFDPQAGQMVEDLFCECQ